MKTFLSIVALVLLSCSLLITARPQNGDPSSSSGAGSASGDGEQQGRITLERVIEGRQKLIAKVQDFANKSSNPLARRLAPAVVSAINAGSLDSVIRACIARQDRAKVEAEATTTTLAPTTPAEDDDGDDDEADDDNNEEAGGNGNDSGASPPNPLEGLKACVQKIKNETVKSLVLRFIDALASNQQPDPENDGSDD